MSDAEIRGYDDESLNEHGLRLRVATLREQLSAAQREVAQLRRELDEAKAEVARWYQTFAGHLYVKSDDYSTLVRRAEKAEAELNEERQRKGYYPGCRELIARSEKAEAERDEARDLYRETEERLAAERKAHDRTEAELDAARADKRAAMERVNLALARLERELFGDAARRALAELQVALSALEDKP